MLLVVAYVSIQEMKAIQLESSWPIEHSTKRPFGSSLVRSIRSIMLSSFHHDLLRPI